MNRPARALSLPRALRCRNLMFLPQKRGFTLVELLVVIAIIGVLVALLLPAVQAAREAARRTQCINQVRQMGIAMQNHVDSHGVFPTGGIVPHPKIEDYSTGGRPNSVDRQGLSWAFQLLPYLEQNAIHSITTTEQLINTPVGLYFCPSRRPPTQFLSSASGGGESPRWLLDYAATVPIPARHQFSSDSAGAAAFQDSNGDGIFNECAPERVWHSMGDFSPGEPAPPTASNNDGNDYQFWGVIVRSRLFVQRGGQRVRTAEFTRPVGFKNITDGSSNTITLTEKRVNPLNYEGSGPADDRGWSDGWDYDTLRLTSCTPYADSGGVNEFSRTAGSSHVAGINTSFADGSVHSISYDIELEVFNRLAHRTDGEVIDFDSF